MCKRLIATMLTVLAATVAAADSSSLAERTKLFARKMHAYQLKVAEDLQQYQYNAPWGASYVLDAFVDAYLGTGDREYLDMFVDVADPVVASRADKLGLLDWKNRSRKGWMAEGFYGIAGPVILLDRSGEPSLAVYSVLLAYNDQTDIVVTNQPDGTFTISTSNEKAGDKKLCRTDEKLTMANVEEKINNLRRYGRNAIRVKRLGDQIPAPAGPVRGENHAFVMHGHHTGKVVLPLLRFAAEVKKRPELQAKYGAAAARYLTCSAEAMDDMDADWREHPDGGYIIFEQGMPFWCDGVPESNNTLAWSGLAYLYLAELSDRPVYAERARKLAGFMRGELVDEPGGTVMYYYWPRMIRNGWTEEMGCENLPYNPMPTPAPEDNSHLQGSLRFFVECYRRNLIFTRADLEKIARTFHRRIYRGPDESKPFTDYFNGKMMAPEVTAYQQNLPGWAEFYDSDPAVAARVRDYAAALDWQKCWSTVLCTWAVLLKADRETAK